MLGAFAAEIAVDLADLERKAKLAVMFDDVACERHGVVEAEGLVGSVGAFASFVNEIDLFFGVAASLGEDDFATLDYWSLNI